MSPTLQADSLPSEPREVPLWKICIPDSLKTQKCSLPQPQQTTILSCLSRSVVGMHYLVKKCCEANLLPYYLYPVILVLLTYAIKTILLP